MHAQRSCNGVGSNQSQGAVVARCVLREARSLPFVVQGKYDTDADISVNTAIASPLLRYVNHDVVVTLAILTCVCSRFDLVLVLLDTVNAEVGSPLCSPVTCHTHMLCLISVG